jgi:hypothetical protein
MLPFLVRFQTLLRAVFVRSLRHLHGQKLLWLEVETCSSFTERSNSRFMSAKMGRTIHTKGLRYNPYGYSGLCKPLSLFLMIRKHQSSLKKPMLAG